MLNLETPTGKTTPCSTCRRTSLRVRETPLLETIQQLARCGRCGDYYQFHRAQHPHLRVSRMGDVQCDGWGQEPHSSS